MKAIAIAMAFFPTGPAALERTVGPAPAGCAPGGGARRFLS